MKFNIMKVLPFLVAISSTSALGSNGNHLRRELKKQSQPCTVFLVSDSRLTEARNTNVHHLDDDIVCELASEDTENGISGQTFPMLMTKSQKQSMLGKFRRGDYVSGKVTYNDNAALLTPKGIQVPSNKEMPLEKAKFKHFGGRKLASTVTGVKPILAVKVIDAEGRKHPDNSSEISDNIFGTGNDLVNMVSQFTACSHGKLNITTGDPIDGEEVPGVIEVTIPLNITTEHRYTIRNAVTSAVYAKLGYTLPGPFEQVMYVLEGCYVDCGWAAYAYINSWNSVYQGRFYKDAAIQLHELGHNFNFGHSGGLDGKTYTDHTCSMGNPLYGDELGKMCFNPAKSWQIGWYEDRTKTLDPQETSSDSTTIVGVADYDKAADNEYVVVKLETRTNTDYFVGFNRATRANAQNDEADNEVTIIEAGQNGNGYSESKLKAHLLQDQDYTISDFGGTGKDLVVTATKIDENTDPWKASVSFVYGDESPPPTPSPTTATPTTKLPTATPTTAPPTKSPTQSPIAAPTKSPTQSPTAAPTTAAPTKSPTQSPIASPTTAAPTKPPTQGPTATPTTTAPSESPTTATPTKSPTQSPTTPPTTTPPTKSPTPSPTTTPTKPPTPNPTAKPTTATPTKSPTPSPTATPTASPTCKSNGNNGQAKNCKDKTSNTKTANSKN